MHTDDIFRHSTTFDGNTVYRNINWRPADSAFSDLLDSDDPAVISEDASLAVRMTKRVRSFINPFTAPDLDMHYQLAIQHVFQRAVSFPTRYGDGSFPVWYGCVDQATTIFETAYHMMREEIDLRHHPKRIYRQRLVYKVACTAILIDLTRDFDYLPRLTDANDYGFTQQIGKRIRTEMHPGLLAPSARKPGGMNLAVFTPRVLSNPELAESLSYELDPSEMRVSVRNGNNQETMSVDGGDWFQA